MQCVRLHTFEVALFMEEKDGPMWFDAVISHTPKHFSPRLLRSMVAKLQTYTDDNLLCHSTLEKVTTDHRSCRGTMWHRYFRKRNTIPAHFLESFKVQTSKFPFCYPISDPFNNSWRKWLIILIHCQLIWVINSKIYTTTCHLFVYLRNDPTKYCIVPRRWTTRKSAKTSKTTGSAFG